MKAITKILSIIALVGCFFSCSEDAYQPKTMELAFEVEGTACQSEQQLTNFTSPIADIDNPNEWITVSTVSSAGSVPKATFTMTANEELTKRTGIVTISAENGDKFIYTITQAAYVPGSFSSEMRVAYTQWEDEVKLPGFPFFAETATTDAKWIRIVAVINGHGDHAVYISVSENATPAARIGTITVTSDHGDVYTLTIAQEAYVPVNLTAEKNLTHSQWEGDIELSGLPYQIATATANVNWITKVKTASVSGGNAIHITVGENTGASSRTGVITVITDHGDTYTVTINQEGQPVANTGETQNEVSNNPAYSK